MHCNNTTFYILFNATDGVMLTGATTLVSDILHIYLFCHSLFLSIYLTLPVMITNRSISSQVEKLIL